MLPYLAKKGEKMLWCCLWRWMEGAVTQGMESDSWSRKRQGNRFSTKVSQKESALWHSDFSPFQTDLQNCESITLCCLWSLFQQQQETNSRLHPHPLCIFTSTVWHTWALVWLIKLVIATFTVLQDLQRQFSNTWVPLLCQARVKLFVCWPLGLTNILLLVHSILSQNSNPRVSYLKTYTLN